MLAECKPDVVAVANENGLRAACLTCALVAGCDLSVDKPLALSMPEQEHLEGLLARHPQEIVESGPESLRSVSRAIGPWA